MRIIDNLAEMIETARGWLFGGTVGCVVIMGPVHRGHLSLLRAACVQNEICVVCLLHPGWLASAARDQAIASTYGTWNLAVDLELLKDAGANVVFLPRQQDLYPSDFSTYVTSTVSWLQPEEREADGAGAFATFMLKMYHLLRPDVFYFGQREVRRVTMLKRLIRDFHLDVELVVLPTVREQSGLALANMHASFSAEEQIAASLLYEALLSGKALIERGERRVEMIIQAIQSILAQDPMLLQPYICICQAETLETLRVVVPNTLLEISVQIGSISLLDNIIWLGDGCWLL